MAMPKSAPFQVAAKRACAAYSPIQPSAFRIQHFPRPRVPASPPRPVPPSPPPHALRLLSASMPAIPVIDLFAGPGGLAEGFASLCRPEGSPRFRIALSIEKDALAHQTLELRAFYRQFPHGELPEEYYEHLRGELSRTELFQTWPVATAAREPWRIAA